MKLWGLEEEAIISMLSSSFDSTPKELLSNLAKIKSLTMISSIFVAAIVVYE